MGNILCTRQAIKSMKQREVNGHIININSILGHKVNQAVPGNKPTNSLYPPIKFAITGLTECIRQELLYLQTQIKITVSLLSYEEFSESNFMISFAVHFPGLGWARHRDQLYWQWARDTYAQTEARRCCQLCAVLHYIAGTRASPWNGEQMIMTHSSCINFIVYPTGAQANRRVRLMRSSKSSWGRYCVVKLLAARHDKRRWCNPELEAFLLVEIRWSWEVSEAKIDFSCSLRSNLTANKMSFNWMSSAFHCPSHASVATFLV